MLPPDDVPTRISACFRLPPAQGKPVRKSSDENAFGFWNQFGFGWTNLDRREILDLSEDRTADAVERDARPAYATPHRYSCARKRVPAADSNN